MPVQAGVKEFKWSHQNYNPFKPVHYSFRDKMGHDNIKIVEVTEL